MKLLALRNGSQIKILWKTEWSGMDEALLKWFIKKGVKMLVVGHLLMAEADELARLLICKDFMCTTGWTGRFEFCHDISFGKING
jgi:hypothetical protein